MRIHTLPSGQQIHVGGRKRPTKTRATHPHLYRSIRSYVVGELPPAPDYDWTTGAPDALSDVLANDRLGDCTSAGAGHIVDAMTGVAGDPVRITEAQAIAFYSATTGYDPADPSTDQGGDEITVCQTWQQAGYLSDGSHAIAGWATIEDFDPTFVQRVGHLFPLYFGIELSDSWMSAPVWDVGEPPDPNNGHCVVGLGAIAAQGIVIDTWGQRRIITWAAIAERCADEAGGNLFAILTQDGISRASGLCPAGIDWATLQADLVAIGGPQSPDSYPSVDP